uniref:Uncharacterized protein n=1 Tax=Chromera velia CCMP2878 TaxID=1169474 RepID=A0A0K6S697_9ALVE|eukprot:Cvel_14738.t2-p1 / transcript=Cvel_14738.t2 / gene=Cvel_14738 / organism=Chromera_velia_CCMP2878 / gene_product=hypothetical protein / transcript_product=hypothetical protein / location=Cvel_scaffold1060:41206-46016(-) / protein_length=197 / sequence_SO=supercontig / SO=protein_coding / is_pseudo=false
MFGLEANEKANGGDGHGTDFKTETGKAWMGGLAGDTKDKEKEKEATTAAKKEEGKSDEAEKAGASDDKGDKNVDEAGGAVDDGLLGVGAEDDEGEPAGGDGPAPSGEGGEAPEKSGEEGGVLGLGEGDAVSVADGNVGEGEDGDLSKARAIAIMESAIEAAYEHEDQPLDLGLDFNDDSTRKGSLGELRRIRRQVGG